MQRHRGEYEPNRRTHFDVLRRGRLAQLLGGTVMPHAVDKCFYPSKTTATTPMGMQSISESVKLTIGELIRDSEVNSELYSSLYTAVVYMRIANNLDQDYVISILNEMINNSGQLEKNEEFVHTDKMAARAYFPDYVCRIDDTNYVITLQGIHVDGSDAEDHETSIAGVEQNITKLILGRMSDTPDASGIFEAIELATSLFKMDSFGMDAWRTHLEILGHSVSEIEKLHSLLVTDPVTGIPNRRYSDEFVARMNESTGMIDAHMPDGIDPEGIGSYKTFVAFIDLNRFKGFQDKNGGHQIGDQMLKDIARGLERCRLENFDHGIIWRQGGDEFGVMVPFDPNLTSENFESLIRSYIFSAFQESMDDGVYYSISTEAPSSIAKFRERVFPEERFATLSTSELLFSIGVYAEFFPTNQEEFAEMLRKADERMFDAKKTLFGALGSRVAQVLEISHEGLLTIFHGAAEITDSAGRKFVIIPRENFGEGIITELLRADGVLSTDID